ncbi:MAG: DUF5103 domain-containing protein [Bacteroidaceae bacterium]|nr:DUF5103 domain-containing protein [Bacteroidaceae bacterium]
MTRFAFRTQWFLTLAILLSAMPAAAQQHMVHDDNIHTLQVVAGDDWLSPPVIRLGGRQRINIAFDDFSHVYRRLAYKVQHCEADWRVSEQLFESDYIEGFHSGNIIDDVTESFNTNTLYTHYRFSVPNDQLQLKMSGNYRVTIYDDNDDQRPVATACFMVVEPAMGVTLGVTTNTDIGINSYYQQVDMDLNYGPLRVVQPEEQLRTVLTQNQQWHDARINAPWQYAKSDGLRWEHCRPYIFNGGNEYRKFEILDVQTAALHVDNTRWDGTNYIATLDIDAPRHNYVYDEDANGAFYVRNRDNIENDRTCEYLLINFRLPATHPYDGQVFVSGQWTTGGLSPRYQLQYDEEKHLYHTTLLLKQGYYSYHYLLQQPNGSTAPVPTEGNYFQTQNNYQAYVYYRELGGRTDRLVGYAQISTR